jgi:phage terminase large subunit-like protein
VTELDKAVNEPSERSKYLRYHLNIPIQAQEDPIIDMPKWQLRGGDVDLRTWPEYDVELLIRKWRLLERPCWAGVDASWTTDLTAIVFTFAPWEEQDTWTFLPFFFMAKIASRRWSAFAGCHSQPGSGTTLSRLRQAILSISAPC